MEPVKPGKTRTHVVAKAAGCLNANTKRPRFAMAGSIRAVDARFHACPAIPRCYTSDLVHHPWWALPTLTCRGSIEPFADGLPHFYRQRIIRAVPIHQACFRSDWPPSRYSASLAPVALLVAGRSCSQTNSTPTGHRSEPGRCSSLLTTPLFTKDLPILRSLSHSY